MFKTNVCRVCLRDSTVLHCVMNTNYQEIYEKLTSTKLEDGLPKSMCFICYYQLKKCYKFAKTALKSHKLLLQWSQSGTVITKSTLPSIEPPHRFQSTLLEVLSLDNETGTIEEVAIKQELNYIKESDKQKIKKAKESLKNDHPLSYNDKSLNDTTVGDKTSSLLRHLLVTNDNVSEYKPLNDKYSNDKSLNVIESNDKSLNDTFSNDKSMNDEKSNDKSLTDKVSNDKSSLLRNLLASNDKSTNENLPVLNHFMYSNDKSLNDNFSNDKPLNDDCEHTDNPLIDHFSSSDDEYLSSFKPKQKKGQYMKDKLSKWNVSVVRVDTTQQRQDMTSRTRSDNYVHSEYKCHYCYRGFTTAITFNKHMDKHSEEKSGKYECDICHYRYRIISRLKIHIENTHSKFYKCNVCGTMLHSLYEAKVHNREHEGLKYSCKLCSKEFKKRTSYFSHVRMKHASRHICKWCGKSFVSGLGVLQHVAKVHRGETMVEESVACYDCDLKFVSLDALYRHRLDSQIHNKSWQHSTICYVCGSDLKNKILLRSHLKEHRDLLFNNHNKEERINNIVFWKCDECSKVFTQKSNMRIHIKRIHMNIKINCNKDIIEDFICEICGLKLKSKGSLTSHRRIHTGERPYQCTSCPKCFHERGQLNLHVRTHTGYRPYNCDQCGKKFTQKTALNRHMRTHTGAKPYTCQVCMKQFTQSNSLKGHISRVHFKLPSYKKMKEKCKIIEKDCQINEINA